MTSPLQVSDLGMQFDPSRQSNSSEEHDVELSQLDRSSSAPSRESKVVTEIIIISGFRFEMCRVGLYSDNCPSFIPLSMLTIMKAATSKRWQWEDSSWLLLTKELKSFPRLPYPPISQYLPSPQYLPSSPSLHSSISPRIAQNRKNMESTFGQPGSLDQHSAGHFSLL